APQAGDAVRRARLAAARRAGAGRARLSVAVVRAFGDRPGQSRAARDRGQEGRGARQRADHQAGRLGLGARQARRLRGGRRAADLDCRARSLFAAEAAIPSRQNASPKPVTTLPETKLDALLARHAMVEAELARQMAPETFVKLSRELAEITPVV